MGWGNLLIQSKKKMELASERKNWPPTSFSQRPFSRTVFERRGEPFSKWPIEWMIGKEDNVLNGKLKREEMNEK
jgi:hypothetical protein